MEGKAGEVVARCRFILATANTVLAALADYGITADTLTTFKQATDAFDGLKTAPRERVVKRRAAAQQLRWLTQAALKIVREELDGLMPQFKESHPAFHAEYFAAREIVDTRTGKPEESKVVPQPAPEPLAKAA